MYFGVVRKRGLNMEMMMMDDNTVPFLTPDFIEQTVVLTTKGTRSSVARCKYLFGQIWKW